MKKQNNNKKTKTKKPKTKYYQISYQTDYHGPGLPLAPRPPQRGGDVSCTEDSH